jgi:uncharacterized protein YndB with AHSA1/START domain
MNTSAEVPDQIEKSIVLRAPLARVWRAVSNAQEFGVWFGVEFDEPFAAGKTIQGKTVPTQVDPEVAKLQEPYRGTSFEWTVERIVPEQRIEFRWHPFAVEKGVDYSEEPTTLITFLLVPIGDGTRLTITESGFSKIPLERRAKAFTANEGGWQHQAKLIEKYLARHGA